VKRTFILGSALSAMAGAADGVEAPGGAGNSGKLDINRVTLEELISVPASAPDAQRSSTFAQERIVQDRRCSGDRHQGKETRGARRVRRVAALIVGDSACRPSDSTKGECSAPFSAPPRPLRIALESFLTCLSIW
jgi:hypothetical protein